MQPFRLVKSLLLPTRIFAVIGALCMLEGACSKHKPRPASPTKGSKDSPVPALTPPSPTVATPATGNAVNTEAPNRPVA